MKKLHLVFFSIALSLITTAQPLIDFTNTITGLTAPVDIVNAKDGSGRMFIVQQNGIIKIWNGTSVLPTPFLDIHTVITYDGGERGLLSMAFHPQYASNGYFYVFYNNSAGNTELAQYHVSADANVAVATGNVMLTITKPYTNHNGCKLNFGPDGDLYISTGDGGSGGDPQNHAQDLNSYLGKMLRINVNNFTAAPYYTVPADNPLVGMAGTLPEIYDWGLRNPFRWSFDRQTGDMWIADVGQNAREEVNFIPTAGTSGLNFGWRCYEGTLAYDLSLCGPTPATGKTAPIFEYGHNAAGGFAIIGGYVYRGAEFPALQGWYICADDVNPNGWLIKPDGAGAYNVSEQNNFPASISGFGEAENGTLYLTSLNGTVYKVILTGVVSVRLTSFAVEYSNGYDLLNWKVEADPSLLRFEVERSDNGLQFNNITSVIANLNQTEYSFKTTALREDRYYRLKMVNNNGTAQYSAIKKISGRISDIIVTNMGPAQWQLHNEVLLKNVFLLNSMGQRVRSLGEETTGTHIINAWGLAKGIYFFECVRSDGAIQKIKVMNF